MDKDRLVLRVGILGMMASLFAGSVPFAGAGPMGEKAARMRDAFTGENKKPNLDQLYKNSNLPRTHADFSMFHFVPRGDITIEQPDQARLLFRTPDGVPDGYAERRGAAVFYYDRTGKAVRVQRLTPEEIDRLNRAY